MRIPPTCCGAGRVLAPESPQLAQVYFYLTNYKTVPVIPEVGMNRIQRYFDTARELGFKLLVRFAYQGDGDGHRRGGGRHHAGAYAPAEAPAREEPGSHPSGAIGFSGRLGRMAQLQDGARPARLLHAIGEMAPSELFLQIRIPTYKNLLDKADPLYRRLGFNIDSTFGYVEPEQMGRGTDGVDPGKPTGCRSPGSRPMSRLTANCFGAPGRSMSISTTGTAL